jgi:hypothetical protein
MFCSVKVLICDKQKELKVFLTRVHGNQRECSSSPKDLDQQPVPRLNSNQSLVFHQAYKIKVEVDIEEVIS